MQSPKPMKPPFLRVHLPVPSSPSIGRASCPTMRRMADGSRRSPPPPVLIPVPHPPGVRTRWAGRKPGPSFVSAVADARRASVALRCNQMRDLGLALEVEALDLRLQHAIRIGDALVLAHVLQPRFDHERLDEPRRIGGVLVDAPAVGAVAPPLVVEPLHRGEKGT